MGSSSHPLRITAAVAETEISAVCGRKPRVKRKAVEISARAVNVNRDSRGNIQHSAPTGMRSTKNQSASTTAATGPSNTTLARMVQTSQIKPAHRPPHRSVTSVAVLNSRRKVRQNCITAPLRPVRTHLTAASYSAAVAAPRVNRGNEKKSHSRLSVSRSVKRATPRQRRASGSNSEDMAYTRVGTSSARALASAACPAFVKCMKSTGFIPQPSSPTSRK